jgi:ATP/ADP translocase
MIKNVGTLDRTIRFVLALVLVLLYTQGVATGAWGIAALVAAVVLLLTGLVRFCPIHRMLGINTCKR